MPGKDLSGLPTAMIEDFLSYSKGRIRKIKKSVGFTPESVRALNEYTADVVRYKEEQRTRERERERWESHLAECDEEKKKENPNYQPGKPRSTSGK